MPVNPQSGRRSAIKASSGYLSGGARSYGRLLSSCRMGGAFVTRWTVILALLAVHTFSMADASRPEDYEGCDAGSDHTQCWQAALDGALPTPGSAYPYFGKVLGEAGRVYYISQTLAIQNAHGGEIDGQGATLVWTGAPNVPLFLIVSAHSLRITNLYVKSSSSKPLHTAIEFAKGASAGNYDTTSKLNILDHVTIDGTDFGGLQYGVRYTARYVDEDNDQSTIINCNIANVTEAAISIEHSHSHDHRFVLVNASGAAGNTNGRFVNKLDGSFTSIGGFHANFKRANYWLVGARTGDAIINENSEGSAALVKTPAGVATFSMPVRISGGRFAVNGLQSNGRVVEFYRYGPLQIDGLKLDGTPPAGVIPRLHFGPLKHANAGYAELRVSGVTFAMTGMNGTNWYDPIEVSGITQATIAGNSCITSDQRATHCVGRSGGIAPAMMAADLGLLSVPGQFFYCGDCKPAVSNGACVGGGTGAFAKRLPAGWFCN